jgi:hypothetical protein
MLSLGAYWSVQMYIYWQNQQVTMKDFLFEFEKNLDSLGLMFFSQNK